MPREQFLYNGTQQLCDLLDEAGRRAGVSRGQSFEDFLTCVLCGLSNRQMEDDYLAVVRKGYGEGGKGRRGIDSLSQAFGTLIGLMEQTRKDKPTLPFSGCDPRKRSSPLRLFCCAGVPPFSQKERDATRT